MLKTLHARKPVQLVLGLLTGVAFGILLQKGGVTEYDVVMGQLLLRDFTVLKIMLSAVLVGLIGVHTMHWRGWVDLHPKPGSVGASGAGGLLFGAGFGLLGYCPGTVIGAAAQGWLDAVLGGVLGLLLGSSLFAALYPRLEKTVLRWGDFGEMTFPRLLKAPTWIVAMPVVGVIVLLLFWIERTGL